ncbi:MAG: EamA family transporter [Arthrobacter sp.]|jgi:drug/metabolite transporter (DMT)-like permease|nr:EamA family transporter [Arthrobacter sp.]
MLGVLLAFAASVAWGGSDFVGGLATRRSTALRATVWTFVGAVLISAIALVVQGGAWSTTAVLSGLAAGVACVFGYLAFFGALATAPMGPVTAVVGATEALVPVGVAIAIGHGGLGWLGWIGVAVAVLGGVVIGLAERGEGRASLLNLLLALAGGLGFGLTVVFMNLAPEDSGAVLPLVEMSVGLVLLGALALFTTRSRGLSGALRRAGLSDPGAPRSALAAGQAIGAGVLFGLANLLLMAALWIGPLAAVGVAVSLYPVTTTVLAWLVLKEKLTRVHVAGLIAALAGCALLALG